MEVEYIPCGPRPHTAYHTVSIDYQAWPKAPGKQKHSHQPGYSTGLEITSQEPRAKAKSLFGKVNPLQDNL